MKKENKDCNFMISLTRTLLNEIRVSKEKHSFNWSFYLRKCIEEKLKELNNEQK